MVRIGEPFELKCAISGQPTPHVIWMKDRKNIQSSDDLILASKSGVYSLFVRAAKKADQGTYRFENQEYHQNQTLFSGSSQNPLRVK